MSSIFVTGGAGLIGLACVEALLKGGHSVKLFDLGEQIQRRSHHIEELKTFSGITICPGTIMDKCSLSQLMRNCDVVIHLAAMLGVKRTEDNRLSCIDININGTMNVVEACIQQSVSKIIFASSSEVYGEPRRNPVDELVETSGKTVYSVSKLCGEEIIKGYAQSFPSLKYTIIRFFNTYGEGQVAQFVLSKFVNSVLNDKPPHVYGDGTQNRSFCHAIDVASAVVTIVNSCNSDNEVFNIGNPSQVYTLMELARKVISIVKPESNMAPLLVPFERSDRSKDREIFNRVCDITKASKLLNYTPVITVDEGIRRIASSLIHTNWPS